MRKGAREIEQQYGLVDNGEAYGSAVGLANGNPPVFGRLQRNLPNDMRSGMGSDITFTFLD